MTARTDLDNAISILDAGISAHVRALKSARDTAASAQAAANDDSYLVSLTSKVLAFADALSISDAVVAPVDILPAVSPDAPTIPAFLLPPKAQQDAQVAQALPETLPVFPSPTVLETMEAAVRSMVSSAHDPK